MGFVLQDLLLRLIVSYMYVSSHAAGGDPNLDADQQAPPPGTALTDMAPYLSLDWPGLEWIYLYPCSLALIDDCDVLSVMRQVKYSPQQYLGAAVVATGIAIVLLPHLRYPIHSLPPQKKVLIES